MSHGASRLPLPWGVPLGETYHSAAPAMDAVARNKIEANAMRRNMGNLQETACRQALAETLAAGACARKTRRERESQAEIILPTSLDASPHTGTTRHKATS